MKLQFVVGNEGRKPLVKAAGEVMNKPPQYMGAPTFVYEVGSLHIDKDGVLDAPDDMDIRELLENLEARGFVRQGGDSRFAIELPVADFGENALLNLERLLNAKRTLIMNAFGADDLPVERTDNGLRFDWFPQKPEEEEAASYTNFMMALCELAKKQTRVTSKPVDTDNEKYAFRCFLLKLGFIGEEYKTDRKILLSKLTGDPAFKSKKTEG